MIYQAAEIKDGKFRTDKDKLRERVADADDGKYLMVLIRYPDKNHRDWQNWYWFFIGEWAKSMGWDKDALHEEIKVDLFPELFDGKTSTTKLTIEEWNMLKFNLENFLINKFTNK